MHHKLALNANLFTLLHQIDLDMLTEVQKQGCSCGGKLHRADYPRSPMGIPPESRHHFEQRMSLCCDTCRKRTAIPTVRFFGRRWYPAPLFLLISLLQRGISTHLVNQVKKHFGISMRKSTWKRWRRWWKDYFIKTLFWQQKRGSFIGKGLLGPYPRSLYQAMQGENKSRLLLLLQFLAPITAGFLRAV